MGVVWLCCGCFVDVVNIDVVAIVVDADDVVYVVDVVFVVEVEVMLFKLLLWSVLSWFLDCRL